MTTKIILTFFFAIFTQIGFSQTIDKAKLDLYFNTLEENNKFMGSVAVSKNGEIVYTKSVGFADVEANLKVNANTKYRIGSISKTFTAVLVLKAVEEGKIDLNQPIIKWFPSIENAKQITVSYLLNHRSGIHNFTNNNDYLSWNTRPMSEKEMVAILAKGGSDFQPDSKAEYSNSNYVLLSYILEKTYKKSYSELLQEHIVKPLELKNTFVFGKINTQNNDSKSYRFITTWILEPETDSSISLGAGAISSTPTDLTKFADALFGGKLLKSESLEKMKTLKEGFGSGLFQIPFHNHTGYGHTGAIDGFVSVYSHFPEDNISYALTSNGTNMNTNDISIAVLSAVFDKPYEIPTFKTFDFTSEDLDQYLGVYASVQIPIKITITKDGNTLIGQATGQQAFPLEPVDEHKFQLDLVGAKFEFNPEDSTMILYQGGAEVNFKKEGELGIRE